MEFLLKLVTAMFYIAVALGIGGLIWAAMLFFDDDEEH